MKGALPLRLWTYLSFPVPAGDSQIPVAESPSLPGRHGPGPGTGAGGWAQLLAELLDAP